MEPKGKNKQGPRKVQNLIAKPVLDGHYRGAQIIARGIAMPDLRLFTLGFTRQLRRSSRQLSRRDVDMIGCSSLAGAHIDLFPRVAEMLK
jgi:methylmalonyl-CoA mutase, C-terminal domain